MSNEQFIPGKVPRERNGGAMGQFGEFIQSARVQSGKTLREVAETLGISVSNLCDIEHGRRKPFSQNLIEVFVKHFGGDLNRLLQLAAEENKMIEIPAIKSEKANTLAFLLARSDSAAFEDEEVATNMERLIKALERWRKRELRGPAD